RHEALQRPEAGDLRRGAVVKAEIRGGLRQGLYDRAEQARLISRARLPGRRGGLVNIPARDGLCRPRGPEVQAERSGSGLPKKGVHNLFWTTLARKYPRKTLARWLSREPNGVTSPGALKLGTVP